MKDTSLNLLFTNVGRRTYMVDYALDLIEEGYNINIFVNDTSLNTAGFWVSNKVHSFVTPRVEDGEDEYIKILLKNCLNNKINLIIPLMDYEIPVLSINKKKFEQFNIDIIVSDYDIIMKCLDKKENYTYCKRKNIKMPKSFFSISNDPLKFPLISKKIFGSGSVGQIFIKDKTQLTTFKEGSDFLQEYIEGTEYGMDILNDLNGNYLHSSVREKLLMRDGETDKAKTIFSNEFINLAKRISNKFHHIGNMDLDFIKNKNGEIFFIDFNPRFGGGYPITHLSGYNYLKAILDIILGNPVKFSDQKKDIIMMKGISIHSYSVK